MTQKTNVWKEFWKNIKTFEESDWGFYAEIKPGSVNNCPNKNKPKKIWYWKTYGQKYIRKITMKRDLELNFEKKLRKQWIDWTLKW